MECTTAVTFPTLFTFYAGSGQYLNWFLQDSATGAPINSSTIVATLYAGRSLTDPTGTPGTPVPYFTDVPLPYVGGSAGKYQAIIPAAFNPTLGSDYVLVVDAITPGYNNSHWEVAAQVVDGTVKIFKKSFIVDPIKFRNDFPEFKNSTDYPESTICFWMGVASLFLNRRRWGSAICLGAELYVAHMIVLEKKDLDAAKTGRLAGDQQGRDKQ